MPVYATKKTMARSALKGTTDGALLIPQSIFNAPSGDGPHASPSSSAPAGPPVYPSSSSLSYCVLSLPLLSAATAAVGTPSSDQDPSSRQWELYWKKCGYRGKGAMDG